MVAVGHAIRRHFSCLSTTASSRLSATAQSPLLWHRSSTSPAQASSNKIIFSGIQPTGVPHLGNYLGALQEWVQLQDQAAPNTKLIFSIANLHALTRPQDRAKLQRCTVETMAALLAVGLDADRSIIFCQSDVPAHTELMWILSCTASMGYLSRMTQWKSKLALKEDASPLHQNAKAKLKLGLFSYPVLQAADILVHGATHVPVGEDQVQHLEFTRECVNSFNSIYGNVLIEPTTLLSPAKRVMSLKDPLQKMSKSHGDPQSKILLTDSPEEIRLKIKHALTDSTTGVSFDPSSRPGVSNLLEILSHVDPGGKSPHQWAEECSTLSMRAFKELVANKVALSLSGFQERYRLLVESQRYSWLREVAQRGAKEAGENSERMLRKVRDAVGI